MKNIIKTCSFMATLCVISGAFAAASRVGMVQATRGSGARLPSVSGHIVSYNTTTGVATQSAASILFNNTDCIDAYTGCLKTPEVCGSDMEECTTNVLLHAKMPNCLGVLYQCGDSGINALFGTSSVSALSNVAEKNTYGEVTRYTYPTDGSVLGQMVIGANIANKLPMDQCVRRYTNCLNRDNVCGEHFELCTSWNEFRKQSIACASTLSRCQSDGLIELFGQTNTSIAPKGTSRLGVAIADGASFAAANAVNTCYKVVDTCLVNSCTKNPWRCVEGVSMQTIRTADFVAGGETSENTTTSTISMGPDGNITSDFNLNNSTGADVRKFIKGSCLAQIGGNKYCYMTFMERTPKDRDLADIDNQEDVFSLAYAARKDFANTKIQEILKKFDKRAKDNCIQTLSSCVRSSCQRGVGSVCYTQSQVDDGIHVNNPNNYAEIKTGCEAVVNMDANCQYAANSAEDDGYVYAYNDQGVFSKIFPPYGSSTTDLNDTNSDPIGAIAAINASLASSYNDAAIAKLKKDCTAIATGCIKSMCGNDYINCYRNRTDVVYGLYNTGAEGFDNSMNKVGGVLDYNIVTGLCVNTIKNSKSCEEHLKIEAAGLSTTNPGINENSWGGAASVRDSWMDVTSGISATQTMVTVGCTVSSETATANTNCDTYTVKPCGTVDDAGCAYTEEYKQGIDEYVLENSANTLLQKLLMDVEREAQAKYNAKLTKEQNICLANNAGGIVGADDLGGSTFGWVKLKDGKIPSNYSMNGLKSDDFVASNDLYGSFCRARVTLTSDDKNVQDWLKKHDKTRYFAVGDAFTCGAWLSQSNLKEITDQIGKDARAAAGEGSAKEKAWSVALPLLVGVGSTIGGWAGMDALQKSGTSLGGLMSGNKTRHDNADAAASCLTEIEQAESQLLKAGSVEYEVNTNGKQGRLGLYNSALSHANNALNYARKLDKDSVKNITFDTLTASGEEGDQYSVIPHVKLELDGYINSCKLETNCKNGCPDNLSNLTYILGRSTSDAGGATQKAIKYATDAADAAKVDGVENETCTALVTYIKGQEGLLFEKRDGTLASSSGGGYSTAAEKMRTNLNTIKGVCESHTDDVKDGNGKRIAWNAGAAAVAGTVGTLGTIAIQKAVRANRYEKAEKEAIQKWMDDVGDKIKCYIGGTELGAYGETISLEIN